MKDIARTVLALVLIALVVAIVLPGGIFVWRLMDTWSETSTAQLLGGLLACLGGMGAVFAAMAGAGVFARFAGWKPPRRDEERIPPPIMIESPPGWDDRPQLNAPPTAPPWGVTGGGDFQMLPAPQQDRRYSMSAPERRDSDR